ncbi:MAG: menaquinone biosynthesis protein [Planctomycetota bacterium]|nr:menaquinone biosynthesis protein [Planctomycetota bacterium]
MLLTSPPTPRNATDTVRLGVVSFVNTLPLIDGLEQLRDVSLKYTVPSLLIDQLMADEVDVALCSSIDYVKATIPMVILPVGLLGCDGPTLTVRLYAQCPLDQIESVYCDTDSHTSLALMQILFHERTGRTPELIAYNAREHVAQNRPIENPQALLLIGDKVVTDSPPAVRYPHQMDLGEAWKELTGLPFVFAVWMAKRGTDQARLRTAAYALDHQRRHNRERLDIIIQRRACRQGWPRDLAAEYLKRCITYDFTNEHMSALEVFYSKAHELGLIPRLRPIEIFEV